MTEVYMKSKTPFSVFQPSPHISTSFRKCLLIALSILQRNKWNKHSVIPEQMKCMTKENFFHSRSFHAFHLSYPSVNENIFLNLCSLMKQKKLTCRAAFPTEFQVRYLLILYSRPQSTLLHIVGLCVSQLKGRWRWDKSITAVWIEHRIPENYDSCTHSSLPRIPPWAEYLAGTPAKQRLAEVFLAKTSE